ncbi:hypothetical protein PMAYCL1PPCAC_26277, partial [Pristionchus mayeri]
FPFRLPVPSIPFKATSHPIFSKMTLLSLLSVSYLLSFIEGTNVTTITIYGDPKLWPVSAIDILEYSKCFDGCQRNEKCTAFGFFIPDLWCYHLFS